MLRLASVYALAGVANGAVGFLLLPVLTRYLSRDDYGVVTLFVLIGSALQPFLDLSLHGAVARRYLDRKRLDLRAYVTTCLVLMLGALLVVGALVWLCAPWLARVSFLPQRWLAGLLAVAAGTSLSGVVLGLLQMQQRPWLFGGLQLARTLVNAGASLYLVVGLGLTWSGRLWGVVAGALAAGVCSLAFLLASGHHRARFRADYARDALDYALPLIPYRLAALVIFLTDRFVVAHLKGIDMAGLYAVGYQFGMIVGMAGDAFNSAWVPWAFAHLKGGAPGQRRQLVKASYAALLSALLGALLVTALAGGLLPVYVGAEFASAGPFVFWIALGFAFNSMYKTVACTLFYAERTLALAVILGLGAVVNVPLSYAMTARLGALGAAQSTAIVFALVFAVAWVVAARSYPLPWSLRAPDAG